MFKLPQRAGNGKQQLAWGKDVRISLRLHLPQTNAIRYDTAERLTPEILVGRHSATAAAGNHPTPHSSDQFPGNYSLGDKQQKLLYENPNLVAIFNEHREENSLGCVASHPVTVSKNHTSKSKRSKANVQFYFNFRKRKRTLKQLQPIQLLARRFFKQLK